MFVTSGFSLSFAPAGPKSPEAIIRFPGPAGDHCSTAQNTTNAAVPTQHSWEKNMWTDSGPLHHTESKIQMSSYHDLTAVLSYVLFVQRHDHAADLC